MSNREALVIPSFDDSLDDFAPRKPAGQEGRVATTSVSDTRRSVDAVSQFPSREASADAQLNLKGPKHVIERFRAMCKADRRAYYDMLGILMDHFESSK